MTKHAKHTEEIRRYAEHSLLRNLELDAGRFLELDLPLLLIARFDVQLFVREVELLHNSIEHARIVIRDDKLKRMRTATAGLKYYVCLTKTKAII